MKALLLLLITIAVIALFLDDKAKRGDLAQAEARADAAQQQSDAAQQQAQHLQARVYQLQAMLSHPSNLPAARPAASGQPAWFQEHLNDAHGVLDPNAGPP
jgi:multidrug resistance efflux pump